MIADTSTPLSTGLKPYPEYKESGSRWLAKVPSHWEVRNLIRIRNELSSLPS